MKVVKGIGKAIKGIVKGAKKVFKKITSSKLGKALLIGATIYLGGAALGAWNSPFASVNGALTSAGSQASQAAAAANIPTTATGALTPSGSLAPGGGVLAPKAALSEGAAIADSVIPTVAGGSGQTLGAASTGAAAGTVATAALPPGGGVVAPVEGARQGILNRLLSGASEKLAKVSGFASEHPYATAMMLNATASALTPDQLDLQQDERKFQEKERQRRLNNLEVGNINLGVSPGDNNLTTADKSPVYRSGFLNTNMVKR